MTASGVDRIAFPDLDAWRRWESRQRRVQRLAASVRSRLAPPPAGDAPGPALLLPAEEPDVLVVIDVWSPSCVAAIGGPMKFLNPRRTAVLTRIPAVADLYSQGRNRVDFSHDNRIPRSVSEVVTLGAFNDLAGRVEPWARRNDARFSVVQHGALTPWAPPLTDATHLFAWSDEDAEYWAAGRSALTVQTVGAQLLWDAAQARKSTRPTDERPLMLGQMHGVELPARQLKRVYTDFCIGIGADYRPHPNERDTLSRLRHRSMRRKGVRFDPSRVSVRDLRRTVVSVFSTGTIEAAHSGLPAFVHHPDPPPWLRAFWRRYGLAEFGGAPSEPREQPMDEPAASIAKAVQP